MRRPVEGCIEIVMANTMRGRGTGGQGDKREWAAQCCRFGTLIILVPTFLIICHCSLFFFFSYSFSLSSSFFCFSFHLAQLAATAFNRFTYLYVCVRMCVCEAEEIYEAISFVFAALYSEGARAATVTLICHISKEFPLNLICLH